MNVCVASVIGFTRLNPTIAAFVLRRIGFDGSCYKNRSTFPFFMPWSYTIKQE